MMNLVRDAHLEEKAAGAKDPMSRNHTERLSESRNLANLEALHLSSR